MAKSTGGPYKLIAAFADVTAAKRAIEALRSAGVKGKNISLLAREGPVVVSDDGKTDDGETAAAALKGAATGAVSGGVLGGLGGFLVGLTALALPGIGPIAAAGVWATTALGALVGAEAGALVGYVSGTELSEERSEAYGTYLTKGYVLLGVQTDDPDEFERAFEVVSLSQPVDVDRFGPGVPAAT